MIKNNINVRNRYLFKVKKKYHYNTKDYTLEDKPDLTYTLHKPNLKWNSLIIYY